MTVTTGNELPFVSVIIPVYKTEKYLRSSVESVINQDYDKISVTLVDDGSPDGSPKLCDELAEQYEKVTVIHKKNGGLSSARNAGLDAISPDSQYVLFLDSDDILAHGAISGMVNMALKTDADIVMPDRYTKVFEKTGEKKIALHFPEECYIENPIQFALNVVMEKGRAWRATAILYSLKIIQENNIRFPVGYTSEDIVFNFNLYLYIDKIAFYPFSTLNCLKRASSITTTFQNGFEKTIWYIDSCARDFLKKANLNDLTSQEKADALLFRNVVVYLFSIMSSKNSMSSKEKKAYAYRLIDDEKICSVLRKKYAVPYFESIKIRALLKLIYFLLRCGCKKTVVTLLEIIPN